MARSFTKITIFMHVGVEHDGIPWCDMSISLITVLITTEKPGCYAITVKDLIKTEANIKC